MRRPSASAVSSDMLETGSSGWQTIRRVLPYLWPEGEGWVKRRVLIAMALLIVARLVSVATPFFYKAAVDALAGEAPDTGLLIAERGSTCPIPRVLQNDSATSNARSRLPR